ncbi:MAG: FAD-dependent oxidoreductase [Acidobacteria bacterium]|nr:FAD-dependent oxidoreductase [Acidobacteriota bacterium]MBI3280550.1 FAD-dependent oxidoreductase [Acidobacteriota bacterium]
MPSAIVVGGGLAGMAAAAALGGSGWEVDLFEARPFLGGRAASYELPGGEGPIDNCQHVLLRCCRNLLDFYQRLGVSQRIRFHREYYFVEPGGRISALRGGRLPAPLHLAGSFARLRFLSVSDKIAVARAMAALARERHRRSDLDRITMLEWLQEKRQTPGAIERFWRQVLVSAINEDLNRMAAVHGFQVFALGFLAGGDAYEMGVPAVHLGDLYGTAAWARWPNVRLHPRTTVERVEPGCAHAGRTVARAGAVILAVPFERVRALADLEVPEMEHAPITGVHLWFDRPVMELPHATLLDRTMQWAFNKGEGRYIQLVVSASRALAPMPRNEIIALAAAELGEFFPAARSARLLKAHVVKEVRATFSARTGLERERPAAKTHLPGVFLAGDWTRTGWPATMEGAVRSGYLAAEAAAELARTPRRFLIADPG